MIARARDRRLREADLQPPHLTSPSSSSFVRSCGTEGKGTACHRIGSRVRRGIARCRARSNSAVRDRIDMYPVVVDETQVRRPTPERSNGWVMLTAGLSS